MTEFVFSEFSGLFNINFSFVPLVIEGYDTNWKEIWSYNTDCFYGPKNETYGLYKSPQIGSNFEITGEE